MKVRFGELTEQSVNTLRLLRDAFGVTFKIKEDDSGSTASSSNNGHVVNKGNDYVNKIIENSKNNKNTMKPIDQEEEVHLGKTVLLSCLGTGYINMSRRIK